MYEVGVSHTFQAWHIMPGMEGPEGRLHTHDYRLEVVVVRAELDGSGMVVDIDVLNDAVKKTIARVEDQNLERIQPSDADAVTVEVFSRWAHRELTALINRGGDKTLSVRIWESPVAFGGYSAAPHRDSSS